jgi:hypothetical protein
LTRPVTTQSCPPSLSKPSQRELERALSKLGGSDPLPVVIATDAYARLLENWICHIEALGIERYLIVALDQPLMDRLSRADITSARCDWDGTFPDFLLQRTLVWEFLARHDVDFVQTDMDAIWLRDPIPEFFARSHFDVLGSEGTFHPVGMLGRWGFVLCTGFFHARPTAGTKNLFSAMRSRGDWVVATDCQYVLNFMLDELGTIWDDAGLQSYLLTFREYDFICYEGILPGTCDTLGLSLGMLPHRLFQRSTNLDPVSFVKHVQRTKDPSQRIDAMRAAGCWMLDRIQGRLGAPVGKFG